MGAEVASWAQTQTSPVPAPRLWLGKWHTAVPGPRKPVTASGHPESWHFLLQVSFPLRGVSQTPDLPHSALPLWPTHAIHFPGQNASSEMGWPPSFSGQKMGSRLFSEYRTALLSIVRYVPIPSALTFPARCVTRQGIVTFILQMRKPSPETLRDWLQDLPYWV